MFKLLLACLLFLFCSIPADAGVLNLIYTPPDLQLARMQMKHERKMQKMEYQKVPRAYQGVPLYHSRQIIQYRSVYTPQQYRQYRWPATTKSGSGCGCANGNCISSNGTCSCK